MTQKSNTESDNRQMAVSSPKEPTHHFLQRPTRKSCWTGEDTWAGGHLGPKHTQPAQRRDDPASWPTSKHTRRQSRNNSKRERTLPTSHSKLQFLEVILEISWRLIFIFLKKYFILLDCRHGCTSTLDLEHIPTGFINTLESRRTDL